MKTKKLLLIVTGIISFLTINLFAQTQIDAGSVSGIWEKANSPYIVKGNIQIDSSETLTIEAGVKVIVSDNSHFFVFGQLLAEGTESDSIIFTAADQNLGWDGLRFFDTDSTSLDSSRISYASFSYGKASSGTDKERAGGVMSIEASSKIIISNSSFYNNTSYGGETYGGGAIYIEKCSPIITNSVFKSNKSENFDGGAILLHYSNAKILDSKFINNIAKGNGGAIMSLYSAPQILTSEFTENTAGSFGGAICLDGVSSSRIINLGSSNPYFFNDSSNIVLKYLTIKNNIANRGGGIALDANFKNDDFPIDFSLSEIIGNRAENGAALFFVEMKANQIPIRNLRISKNITSGAIVYFNGGQFHDFLNLSNCIIDHNYVENASSSTGVFDGFRIKLVNCVVADNKCNQVADSELYMTIENSIIWHNDGGLILWYDSYSYAEYSIVQYPWSHFENGEGLKHSDPLFVDHENGNYHLSEGSPAIDNGNPTTNYFDKMLAPDAGLGTLANDMGAYGGKLNAWAEQPIANFTADTTKGASPLEVHFKNLSMGSPKEFAWDFDGDGRNDSHSKNPTHVFTNPGTYTVRLAVNSFDYADTIIFKNYITVQGNDISGAVSGNWFLDTMRIVGDIYVPKDSTLTINPGTYVYFTGEYKFDVYGTLVAKGTETDSIFFVSDSLGEISSYPYYAGFWYGITFHSTDVNGQTPSVLDYCNIKYAYPNWLDEMSNRYGGGLVFYKSQIDVSHTTFTDCMDDNLDRGVFTSINSNGNINGISFLKTESYSAGTMTLLSSNVNIENLYMNNAFGLYFDSSKVKIKNAILDNCSPYSQWGILNAENSKVEMIDCKITNNSGIGIFAKFSSFVVKYTLIKSNTKEGGVFIESPSTFRNCKIIENGSTGLRFQSSQNWGTTFTSEINNCVIAKNNLSGLRFLSRNNANITNCTIADNTNSSGWGGVSGGEIEPHLKNCIVYNNGNDLNFQAGGLYTYSIIQGNYVGSDTATTNLQNVDPLFRDATNNDYHLQSIACGNSASSPGIDAGDPNISDYILDCASAGLGTKLSDIGAYGGEGNWWDKSILPSCHFTGEVSGIWNCKTITVDGNIVIPEGDTLIISETVDKVLISGPYQIKVKGVLLAVGSEREGITKLDTDYIKFQGENWKGIFFNNLNDTNVGTSIIENCRFDYADKIDMPYQGGGAIAIYNSDKVEVKHSAFYANNARYGGAIYIENSNPHIEDCYFELNGKDHIQNGTALTTAGGALYIKNSSPYLHKLQFINNHSISGGGAMVADNVSTTISNILLAENKTEGMGGAIEILSNVYGSLLKIVNMTSTKNISKSNGGGTFHTYGENTGLEVINSIMYDNTKVELYIEGKTPVITYSIIEGDSGKAHFGIGCLDVDPLLESTTGNIYRLGTSLLGYSPAIDAGHPDSLDAVLSYDEGQGTPLADMGYYGGRYSDKVTGVNNETLTTEIPSTYALMQNYPNPFNPSTTINYSIPLNVNRKSSVVSLKVYDILGREVATLVNKAQPAGNYSVKFDASHLSSGLYLYRIEAGDFVDVRKMMLLK